MRIKCTNYISELTEVQTTLTPKRAGGTEVPKSEHPRVKETKVCFPFSHPAFSPLP